MHRTVAEEFTAALTTAMADLTVGPGCDPHNAVGALVSTAERDKIDHCVTAAVSEGALITTGGGVPLSGSGAFYEPTVLAGVAHDATILRNEIFGPVARS